MELADLIRALSRPGAYPGRVARVEVVQTHCSVVFLVGGEVYKVKKPVDFGFLDYSTLEKREQFCQAEVELNRRLAPHVYLGVVPITREGAGLAVQGKGEVVEWAVHMRRLPDDARIEAWLARGELSEEHMHRVAKRVAAFHAGARRGDDVSRYGRFEIVAHNCRENFDQIAGMIGETVSRSVFERLRSATEVELRSRRALIEARAEADVPCDTHGDLRVDHVYLFPAEPAPADLCIVDCIEFNERFRYADPVTDIAFLAMDLHAHGAWDLARELVDAYFSASGDERGRALLPLYLAYRATVRGKVDGMRAAEPEVPATERARARDSARGHLLLALRELSPPPERPCLVLVAGLPGTGKSVLARDLAEHGFRWVRSDVVRKELAGLDPLASGKAAFGTGIYTAQWSDRTYDACLRLVEESLFAGERVVVDATFIEARRRRPFAEAARRWGVPLVTLVCYAPAELVRARIDAREHDPSDADWAIYEAAARRYEPPAADEGHVVTIDASGTPASMVERAHEALSTAHLW